MTSLIHVNGPPGIGKSTLSALYADRHPGTLNLDIDSLHRLVGGWQDADFREVVLLDEKAGSIARFDRRRDDSAWGEHNRRLVALRGGPVMLAAMYDRLLVRVFRLEALRVPTRQSHVVLRSGPAGTGARGDSRVQEKDEMDLPPPRGPVSGHVIDALRRESDQLGDLVLGPDPVLDDADVQLALWVLYELHFRGFDTTAPEREWDPDCWPCAATSNGVSSVSCERRRRSDWPSEPRATMSPATCSPWSPSDDSPSPASYLQRHGSRDQMLDFLRERSVAQLKESDPQAFVVARLEGPAKVALAEVQYDEFGAGRPEHLHQTLYADALEAAGLDPTYGAYLPEISGISLAMSNVMSMFALHRRLRGAAVGHFAAFEAIELSALTQDRHGPGSARLPTRRVGVLPRARGGRRRARTGGGS